MRCGGDALKNVEAILPLSPLQNGVLFHSVSAESWDPYLQQTRCRVRGPLDPDRFRRAWQSAVDQHDALRTAFFWEGLSEPVQTVRTRAALPWEVMDWSAESDDSAHQKLSALVAREREEGLDLSNAPLLRLRLIKRGPEDHHLVLTVHHLVLDGWSLSIVLDHVFKAYAALAADRALPAPAGPPFTEYLRWRSGFDSARSQVFWRQELAGRAGPTLFGIETPEAESFDGDPFGEFHCSLGKETTAALSALARDARVTRSNVVTAAWSVLLQRYSEQDDVVVGLTVAGRAAPIAGIEFMAGMLINTLPLRLRIDPEVSVAAWLNQVQAAQARILEHETTSLSDLREWTGLSSREPLFENLLVFDNYPMELVLPDTLSELSISELDYGSFSNFPIALKAVDGDALELSIKFDRRRVNEAEAAQLLENLRGLLLSFVRSPDRPLRDLSLADAPTDVSLSAVSGAERAWGASPVASLIERAGRRHPGRVAVRFDDQELDYAELIGRSGRVARGLNQLGVGADCLVGLWMDRSLEAIVALVGILRAGAAYYALDPEEPPQRARDIWADADVSLVLASPRLRHALQLPGALVLDPEELSDLAADADEGLRRALVRDTTLAYVICTSGSTGLPKGVAVEQRQISNYLSGMDDLLALGEDASFLTPATLAADLVLTALLGALCSGGTFEWLSRERALDARGLAARLVDDPPDCLKITPSHLLAILEELNAADLTTRVRRFVIGGEPFSRHLRDRLRDRAPDALAFNHYGPTEVTVGGFTYRADLDTSTGATLPLGSPRPNVRACIQDRWGRVAWPGMPGEILIAGDGLSRGYLNRSELTAERFVTDDALGERRWYRSGDRGRLLPNGDLVFMGRIDQQVKVRGFRVEPGEVEHVLSQHPRVRRAAVVTRRDAEAGVQLIAFVEADDDDALEEIRLHVRQTLPLPMFPALWMLLPALPLTPNGKVDRRALLGFDVSQRPPAARTEPKSPLEVRLVEIWRDVLQLQSLGIDEDFFELGGHSLLAMKLVGRVREHFQLDVSVAQFLRAPTVACLAQQLERCGPADASRIPITPRSRRAMPVDAPAARTTVAQPAEVSE